MRMFGRFNRAKKARERENEGSDGWLKHPADIAAEMQEELVDTPVWGIGIERADINTRQRILLDLIGLVAALGWYLTDHLRRTLE